MTVLYGTSVSDTTLTTANTMASASGGTETSKLTTTVGASGNWCEVLPRGGTSSGVASIPATPTGKGWVFSPGAGTFATGNWSATVTLSGGGFGGSVTTIQIRFSRYSGGTYTVIGSLPALSPPGAKTANNFTATSMSSITFAAGDLLYVDLWINDTTGIGGDNPTVYESTSATAGVANDMQVTTSTFTPASSGNTIVGRARAKYLEAITQLGASRSKFTESIGSFGRSRSKFTVSIAVKGLGRARFTESIGSTGRIRSKFVESQALKGRIRSRFYGAVVSKGLARAKFSEAIAQKSGARSKFLLSIGQKAASRSKFLVSKAIKGLSRSSYLVSKASRGLARSKFTEAIVQKGQARSKFSLSAVIKGLAESTFKIAVAGGHAISAYMRSRYKVSIRQAQAQRSKFLIRFSQSAQVHSKFLIRFAQAAQSRTRFLVRFGITGRARSHYLLSIRQTAVVRSRFITRLALVVVARSKFLVQGIVVIYPIKSITHAVSQALSAAWSVLEALGLVSSHAPALTITHQELAMPAPNSTILPTITVTDISGALVSNASAVSLVVYFPDGTTSNYSLTSGITNLGAGQYQAKYNTKGPGEIREVWSIVGADGTTLASAQFLIGVEY